MICKICKKEREIVACEECAIHSLINNYPEVFQENVFDKLNPMLKDIKLEIEFLKNALKDFKIRGFKLKGVKEIK